MGDGGVRGSPVGAYGDVVRTHTHRRVGSAIRGRLQRATHAHMYAKHTQTHAREWDLRTRTLLLFN